MVKSKLKKQHHKLHLHTKKIKFNKLKTKNKNKKQIGGNVTQEDINLWRGFNGIVNSYINYKIFLKDGWKTDSCKFFVDGFEPFKELNFESKDDIMVKIKETLYREENNIESNPTIPKLLIKKCKDEDDSSIKCKVTPDSSGDKVRCHLETNYNIFKEGIKIKIPNKDGEFFELVKIIYLEETQTQQGGSIDEYIDYMYNLNLLNTNNTTKFYKEQKQKGYKFSLVKYVKQQILKYLVNGSFFFYLNETKKKLVINFPMYDDPYLSYFREYHHKTNLTERSILDGIRVHNGYNDLVLKHIDEIDKMITIILSENPDIDYILFTGHSMGSSVIQLTLFYLLAIKKNKILIEKFKKNIKLFTTGASRVGNFKWFEWWNQQGFNNQIFNVYDIDDTYAITPGIENKPPYQSHEEEDFYPINPILFDYKETDSYKIVKDADKRKKFFDTHFDYLNFKSDTYSSSRVYNHDLSIYEEMFKTINLSELTQPII
jgi:hypothetical protein